MSRAHATRPSPATMARAPGPVPASSPELSSMSASSPPVRRLKQAWSRGRGRNLPGRDVHTRDEEPRARVGVARARRRHRRVGSRPGETARRAGRSARGRGRSSRRGPGGRQAPPRRPTELRARGRERTPPCGPRADGAATLRHERSGGSGALWKPRRRADRGAPVLLRSERGRPRAPVARRERAHHARQGASRPHDPDTRGRRRLPTSAPPPSTFPTCARRGG
jgi:hypothetical protein